VSIAFDDASSQYLEMASAILIPPFSVSAWFNSDSLTVNQVLFCLAVSGQTRYHEISAAGGQTGDPCRMGSNSGGGQVHGETAAYTANVWHHVCGYVASGGTSRWVALNDGTPGTESSTVNPTVLNRTAIGRSSRATPTNYMSGMIAEVGVYSDELSAAEITLLAAGTYPDEVNVANCVAYWPLTDATTLTDEINSYVMTAYNTPTNGASHPTMQSAGGLSIPIAHAYYQQLLKV